VEKTFTLEVKDLKNIALFAPEMSPDSGSDEGSVLLSIANDKLRFEILSFRYLLTGRETINGNTVNTELSLPLRRLQDIVKSFSPTAKITFKESKDEAVNVDVEGIKFKIKTLGQDGKNQVSDERGEGYSIPSHLLMDGVKRVRIAMGDDEVRYYLNGISIEVYKDNGGQYHAFLAATNGHVMSVCGEKSAEWTLMQKAIIPKKVIPDVVKVLEKADENVVLSFVKNKMNLATEHLEIFLKLVEAEFPDYERIIPYNNSKEVKFDVTSLKDVLGKILLVSNDKTKNVRISFNSGLAVLELASSDGSVANGSIVIDYSGDTLETSLNAKYLLDILAQLSEKNVVFKLEDGVSPILIQQENNKNLLFVLMPVRL